MEGNPQYLHDSVIKHASKSSLFDEFDSGEKQNLIQ